MKLLLSVVFLAVSLPAFAHGSSHPPQALAMPEIKPCFIDISSEIKVNIYSIVSFEKSEDKYIIIHYGVSSMPVKVGEHNQDQYIQQLITAIANCK